MSNYYEIKIDPIKYEMAHEFFLARLRYFYKNVEFKDFNNKEFNVWEVKPKRKITKNKKNLELKNWEKYLSKPGKITDLFYEFIKNNNVITYNYEITKEDECYYFIHPRYNLPKILRKIAELKKRKSELKEFENVLYDFFKGNGEFETKFNNLIDVLKKNRIPKPWEFISLLCYVCKPKEYFTVKPTFFDLLFKYFGLNIKISNNINWGNYQFVLQFAEAIKNMAKSKNYGEPDNVQVQAYLFLIGYSLDDDDKENNSQEIRNIKRKFQEKQELEDKINKWKQENIRNSEIGIAGEKWVYESEKKRLEDLGYKDVSSKVKWVAYDNDDLGYDILSWDNDQEIYIEVKTTEKDINYDDGFKISLNEIKFGEENENWRVYRVYKKNDSFSCKNLGNITRDQSGKSKLKPIKYFYNLKGNAE